MLDFDGGSSLDTVTVSYSASSNNASVSEGTIIPAASATTIYTLENLQPLTNYTITVIVANSFGPSLPTTILKQTKSLRE